MTVHLINLDRDTERLAWFRRMNPHVPDVVRFPAADGRRADRSALVRDGTILENLTYNPGQLGCALSHAALWRLAVSQDSPMTVVEDDVLLAGTFAAAHDAMTRQLPAGWGIILWGWNFDRPVWAEIPEGIARAVLHFDQDALRAGIAGFQSIKAMHAPIRLRHAFGTMAYTVSPLGARTLLERCLPLSQRFIPFEGFGIDIPNKGIDCLMNLVYPGMKSYVCVPPLAVSENRHELSHTHRPL